MRSAQLDATAHTRPILRELSRQRLKRLPAGRCLREAAPRHHHATDDHPDGIACLAPRLGGRSRGECIADCDLHAEGREALGVVLLDLTSA
eukprot:7003484-Prymnesium_polylepis.1